MGKYIVIYHAPMSAAEQMEGVSPEDAADGMDEWMAWAGKVGDRLVDLGTPLGNGRRLGVDGSTSETDSGVAGYSILEADSTDHAVELLQGHPHLNGWNAACTIEVHEALPLPGME